MATNPDLADADDQGRGGPVVADLMTRARNGDNQAWDALVERYAPLIWSICRRHGLGDADVAAVGQAVWLNLADQLEKIRLPAVLPRWLATTTRRECDRILRAAPASGDTGHVPGAQAILDDDACTAEEELLAAECHAALREAFTHLSPCCQQLIALLTENPPLSYAQISARLGTPAGSIGPNRGHCLDKLRRHPGIAALINPGAGTASSGARPASGAVPTTSTPPPLSGSRPGS
jgi:RNA polymerase sigma factor (sigma-70 family)